MWRRNPNKKFRLVHVHTEDGDWSVFLPFQISRDEIITIDGLSYGMDGPRSRLLVYLVS